MGILSEEHYYWDNGKFVFTEQYHIDRGVCCGNGCRHCPYIPKYKKGNNNLEYGDNTTTDSCTIVT
jgi:hypothetical protein